VRSEEASIGARVRVGERGLHSELRGLRGKIIERWGHPEYLALDVRLEDGSSRLFWRYELEEAPQQWVGLGEITSANGANGS
jgi:hypothetical protein